MAAPLPFSPSPPTSDIIVTITEDNDTVRIDPVTGTIEQDRPDGGVDVTLDPPKQKDDDEDDDNGWFANLVDELTTSELSQIANDLIDAIQADDNSRQGALENYKRGLTLLGLELKQPGSVGVGDSSAAVEGQSVVDNPLLLEAVIKGWANAQAEMLPAGGPVKVKDDGDETTADDALADTYERDWNHWFTTTAREYYPDTRHMLLWGTYFAGKGFKKVYRCPMRRRPVSESVPITDLIVSDASKGLRSCERITHQIMMRKSTLKRMIKIGAYRDAALTQPYPDQNQVGEKVSQIEGKAKSERPEDQPYTIWESQCELHLDQFLPDGHELKGEGIAVPYVVTINKDDREILALRRDFDEDDEDAERRTMYVEYPYIPGPGFLGTGLLHLLGNSTAAMTAAWRLALDSAKFASFPGGLMEKQEGRQNTSDIRVGPGQFYPINTGGKPIQQAAMPLPYHDVTAGMMAMIDKVTQQASQVGGTAEIPVGEGIQNIPVGTMLTAVEQATKMEAAVHKGLHGAQTEEIELLKDLFRERPRDFWRSNKVGGRDFWDEQKFQAALDNCKLVPVSDPNVPSHIHRVAKALALVQLFTTPGLGMHMDPKEVLLRCLRVIREDPNGLVVDPPPMPMGGPPQDPAKMVQAQASMLKAQTDQGLAQVKAQESGSQAQLEAAKLQGEQDIAKMNLQREVVIHAGDAARLQSEQQHEQGKDLAEHALAQQQHGLAQQQHATETVQTAQEHDLAERQHAHDVEMDKAEHQLAVKESNKPQPKPAKPKGKA